MHRALHEPLLSTGFTSEYHKSGKKLDMGKGCVRFNKLEDLALDVVGRTVARVSVEEHIANYQAARARGKSSAKQGVTKSADRSEDTMRRCGLFYGLAG